MSMARYNSILQTPQEAYFTKKSEYPIMEMASPRDPGNQGTKEAKSPYGRSCFRTVVSPKELQFLPVGRLRSGVHNSQGTAPKTGSEAARKH